MKRYIHIILALVVVVGLLSVQAQDDITSEDQVEPSPGTLLLHVWMNIIEQLQTVL